MNDTKQVKIHQIIDIDVPEGFVVRITFGDVLKGSGEYTHLDFPGIVQRQSVRSIRIFESI